MANTILRLPAVKAESGYARSTLYRLIQYGLWTRPVSLGARAVGWPAAEVEALIAVRIAGKSDDEIRDLVDKLHADRPACATVGAAVMRDDPTRDNLAKGLREALWMALFFAEKIGDTTTRDHLCELWRDVVQEPEVDQGGRAS